MAAPDQPSRPSAPPSAPRTRLPLRTVVSLVAVALAMAWAVVGYRVLVAHQYDRGERGYAVPAGGDHLYYASTMLQLTGTPYARSLTEAADAFDYPLDPRRLNYGYLDPVVAPLVYARPTLPLAAAPFEPVLGAAAIEVPGVLAALAVPFVMLAAARRLRATRWLAVPLVLLLLTMLFDEYGTGVYTEAIVGLLVVAACAALPWDRRPARVTDLAWLGAVVVAGSLTRQIGPAFAGLALGGLAWGLAFGPDRRGWWRSWWPASTVATVVAALSTLAVQRWAPYDVLGWTARDTGASSRREGLLRAVERIPAMFRDAWVTAWTHDPALAVLVVMGVVAVVLCVRHPLTGALLGVAAPMVLTAGLNGTAPFRYCEPALLVMTLLVAVAMTRLWPGSDEVAAAPTARAARRRQVWALVPLGLALVLVAATVVGYQAAPTFAVGTVTAADVRGPWPLTVSRLDLECGGDDAEVWGTTPAGERVAVTGTAMARTFDVPSVTTLLQPTALGTVPAIALVRAAVARCPVPVALP